MKTNHLGYRSKLPYVTFEDGYKMPAHYMWHGGDQYIAWNCSHDCHKRQRAQLMPVMTHHHVCSKCGTFYRIDRENDGFRVLEVVNTSIKPS
ncbi:hypothetical protein CI610_00723 [invertebrate metagenome]|uniref:Uncharacterized protein n=1 Tax=invertebrate metagenome TaxID=1711999 RepID=A0A2H9TAM5_9ZZZZ